MPQQGTSANTGYLREYAARGGKKSKGYRYAGSNEVDEVAWYIKNSGNKTHPVGQKKPNELRLHDMSGNVCEWCQDYYGADYYSKSNGAVNPQGPKIGEDRILRGGSSVNLDLNAAVSNHDIIGASDVNGWYMGFRLCRTAKEGE